MGTTFIYHKKQTDDERARMEHDYQLVTARKKPHSRLTSLSGRWNRIVEAITAAASFSTTRKKATDSKKDEE